MIFEASLLMLNVHKAITCLILPTMHDAISPRPGLQPEKQNLSVVLKDQFKKQNLKRNI